MRLELIGGKTENVTAANIINSKPWGFLTNFTSEDLEFKKTVEF